MPYPHGPLDSRMGAGHKKSVCQTCNEDPVTCVGHFGFIDFCVPIFHFGFFKTTHFTLQIICKVSYALLPRSHLDVSSPFVRSVV